MAMDTSSRFANDESLGPLFARQSDPETSQESADATELRCSHLRAKFVEGCRKRGGSATAKEAGYAITTNPELADSIRKRARECVELGVVRIAGKRQCTISGNASQVYEVVN